MRLAVITPVKNEALNIEATLRSVVSQTHLPICWFILDDYSTDDTQSLIKPFTADYPWIKLLAPPRFTRHDYSSQVVNLFNYGLSKLDTAYDIVLKLDGDVSFGPDFFACILQEFDKNQQLGIASGHLTINGKREQLDLSSGNTRGATKFYRQKCLDEIGGIYPYTSWDTVDNAAARAKGWQTQILPFDFEHLKEEGSKAGSKSRNHYRTGLSNGRIPYLLAYFALKALSKIGEPPLLLAPLIQTAGYIRTRYISKERPFPEFITRQIRREQWDYLMKRIGIRN
jgi:poly-beta-1,6-N-acetyl-D-glucosamine synthase